MSGKEYRRIKFLAKRILGSSGKSNCDCKRKMANFQTE